MINIDDETKKILESEINKVHDACQRYDSNNSAAVLYHEKNIDSDVLSGFLRKNDKVIRLDENHCFVVFGYTSETEAYNAAKHLLAELDKYFKNSTTCIAIESACKYDSANIMINKLFQILKETKKNSISRIEYEDILDEVV